MIKRVFLIPLALLVWAIPIHSGDFVAGSTTCPSSGAAQVSIANYNFFQLTVMANSGNTGKINLGDSTVTTSKGVVLSASGVYTVNKPSNGINPSTLYFACTVNTDGLTWTGAR